jgi:cytochrome P450
LPFFSKKAISKFQPIIKEKIAQLCQRIDVYAKSGKPLPLNRAMTAFSGDVITTYVFGKSYDHLNSPDFQETFHEPFMAASEASSVALQFKWIYPVLNKLPPWLVLKLNPKIFLILQLEKVNCRRQQTDLLTNSAKQDFDTKLKAILNGTSRENPDHPTILFEMLRSDLPESEKHIKRLNEEAQLLVAAGLLTASWAMTVAAFHIIDQPAIYHELRAELAPIVSGKDISALHWSGVENLPYLNACVREALRLSYGVTARSPRVWDRPLDYNGWKIPARTPVGLTVVHHNHNEEIFPASHSFKPERWLLRSEKGDAWEMDRAMDKVFHAFGKGSRSCLGVNLAMAQIHLCLATLFSGKYEFKLFGTDVEDVRLAHDFFLPSPKLDSEGVRVKVKNTTA